MSQINRTYPIIVKTTAVLSILGILSCASNPDMANVDPNSEREVNAFQIEINERKQDAEHLASPHEFSKAEEGLEEAREMMLSGEPTSAVVNELNRARAHFSAIDQNVETARFHMPEVFDARKSALRDSAEGTESFKDADHEFAEVGREIEKGDLNEISDEKAEVVRLYQESEVKGIQKRELAQARENLKTAKELDADQYFSEMIKTSEKKIESAMTLIEQNKDDPAAYDMAVNDATQTTDHLLARAQTADWIDDRNAGELAVILEQDLEVIAGQLGNESTIYQSYPEKITYTLSEARFVPMMKSELSSTRVQAIRGRMRLTSLQKENRSLSDEVDTHNKIQSKLTQVREMFDPSEAEVLQKGNDVVIRLIGLNFQVNQAKLPEDSDALLGKVAKSIELFGKPRIEVQGHTDATGRAQYNMMLSKKRAHTVGKYLIDETRLARDQVEMEGYGFTRPVSDNKTANSRMINRRIDIVIESVKN